MSKKYVYLFKEADGDRKDLFGGKGANLAKMTSWGMPVPPGFTITTEACTRYYDDGERLDDEIVEETSTPWRSWKKTWARRSATKRIPSSCPCVRAQERPCPA